jgi:DNA invertase Pin-like site-specific DNA recombinase
MGVFAEFERAMIHERVKSALERVKAQADESATGSYMVGFNYRRCPAMLEAKRLVEKAPSATRSAFARFILTKPEQINRSDSVLPSLSSD